MRISSFGVVTNRTIFKLHSMLVCTEVTARKVLTMGEVSLSLLDSTLGDVARLEEARKRLEDSVELLDWAGKKAGRVSGRDPAIVIA